MKNSPSSILILFSNFQVNNNGKWGNHFEFTSDLFRRSDVVVNYLQKL